MFIFLRRNRFYFMSVQDELPSKWKKRNNRRFIYYLSPCSLLCMSVFLRWYACVHDENVSYVPRIWRLISSIRFLREIITAEENNEDLQLGINISTSCIIYVYTIYLKLFMYIYMKFLLIMGRVEMLWAFTVKEKKTKVL